MAGGASGPARTVPHTGHASAKQVDPETRVWPISDPENLWFCVMNMDVDGYYCEFRPPDGRQNERVVDLIHEKIEGYL